MQFCKFIQKRFSILYLHCLRLKVVYQLEITSLIHSLGFIQKGVMYHIRGYYSNELTEVEEIYMFHFLKH